MEFVLDCKVMNFQKHWLRIGDQWSATTFGHLTPGSHWIRGSVSPISGLNGVEKGLFDNS
jgi:hypothetical protein